MGDHHTASPPAVPLLQVSHLSKRYPLATGGLLAPKAWVQALHQVSFTLYRGKTLGLVGESGCGKSTLARCLMRLVEPTEGSITLNGEDWLALKGKALQRQRQRMQLIFQNPYASLNPKHTVREILSEPFLIHNLAKGQALNDQVVALLEQVGLGAEALDRLPKAFSGGQRQRIGIARALALHPQLIIADEPVSALDVSIQAQILNLLNDLKTQQGLTYLFISHNLGVVRYMCDAVMVMYLGRVAEWAPTPHLFAHPAHPYTQALLQAVALPNPQQAKLLQGTAGAQALLNTELPNPVNPPSGCVYHPRCPYATPQCQAEEPTLRLLNPAEQDPEQQHWVACHHPLNQ